MGAAGMKNSTKHIAVIGAGPGGLTAAMILANRGFNVSVFEKQTRVGGRNGEIKLGEFTFDVGPTFLMMKDILDEVMREAGVNSSDLLDFRRLDPMYRLQYSGSEHMDITADREQMKRRIAALFPGKEDALNHFFEREQMRFRRLFPCLQKPYHKLSTLFSWQLMQAVPHIALGRSLFDVMYDYFQDERLALSFTFQAKYLGMSPWDCPGLFAILPYIEHHFGVYHVQGGLCRISEVMADVARRNGADIHLGTPVSEIIIDGRTAVGVKLENGEEVRADDVVVNADFGRAMCNLVPDGVLRKYSPEKLERKRFSCSTFMLYLGVDTVYDVPHHTIVFADDYKRNVDEVFKQKELSDDFSFYIRNASVTDPTSAPRGQSALYVLVPVPNLRGDLDWEELTPVFRERVLDAVEARTGMSDIRRHIVAERIIGPNDWQDDFEVYAGATFNLGHNFGQMIYLRPHNQFEELQHCYLVGGGTHPGSGLPTIYESGRISANLISRQYNVPFTSANLHM